MQMGEGDWVVNVFINNNNNSSNKNMVTNEPNF